MQRNDANQYEDHGATKPVLSAPDPSVEPGHTGPEKSATPRNRDAECLLRAVDLQAQLGLSRAKVYRLMRENILPTVRIGGSIRVPQKALAKWIEEHTFPGGDAHLLIPR
jgi:excisionase family DNA binding protein